MIIHHDVWTDWTLPSTTQNFLLGARLFPAYRGWWHLTPCPSVAIRFKQVVRCRCRVA